MSYRNDPRTEELNNLKLALATFALQLDAFEARLKGRQHAKPDIAFANQVVGAMKNRHPVDLGANRFDDEGPLPAAAEELARSSAAE